ncbi:MAG: penicillin-binding protein activator [Gallionella sp.]|nr:penicillin-binding protein activator [Gallionella sp.]
MLALYVSGFASATAEILLPAADKPVPHIALLLPLNSPALGAAASAVHQGILSAASLQSQGLPVRVYSDYDEAGSVVATYKRAINNGAVAVLGPLTRNGIRQLADEKTMPVPTLALNIIEGQAPPRLYFFGMAIETEARQIAMLARKQGLKQAIVITAPDTLTRRLQFAFEEQWTAQGGSILHEIEYSGDTMVFAGIAATPDTMVFFATDVEISRTIRPYLPNNLAAYATSQLFAGNKDTLLNFDFDGIRFVDMPWLMQTDQAAVMAYPRAYPPLSTDQERLYALGIDAFRLIRMLLAGQMAQPLDGVTGRIRLNGQTFRREALPALFVQGHGQAADTPVAQAVQMFPDQFKNIPQAEAALPMSTHPKP